jgi:alanyl-tRNA synthetase
VEDSCNFVYQDLPFLKKERTMTETTKRLYFEDPYQVEFEARVVERMIFQDKPALVLDKTCFYPEGGGQPADKGTLSGVPVLHVLEENNRILHVLEEEITEREVTGKIDWDRRFDHMQQHSGQHILSQCFVRAHEAETRSFHLGEKTSTLEIDLRNIDEKEVKYIEKLANDIVFQDREVKSSFFKEQELRSVPLRRPPQKKGKIRVVEVTGFDCTACGGTHPHRTGEIGIIKILRWDRIRNNVRFEFVCGKRALMDYTRKHRDLYELSNRLTVDDAEVLASVEKLAGELKHQKKANKKIQEKLAQYEADEIIRNSRGKIIRLTFPEKTPDEVRSLVLTLIRKGEFVVLAGVRSEERVHVFLARSENIDLDLRDMVSVISSAIDGRGGGRPSLVEIAGVKKENLEMALEKAYAFLSKKIKRSVP